MHCLNRVELVGRVGSDEIEIVRTSKDQSMLTLSVATNEKWIAEDGTLKENVTWHRCVFFRKCAEHAKQFLTKGALVFVTGKLSNRRYTDNSGNQRTITEIQVSDFMVFPSSNVKERSIAANEIAPGVACSDSSIRDQNNKVKNQSDPLGIYSMPDLDEDVNF